MTVSTMYLYQTILSQVMRIFNLFVTFQLVFVKRQIRNIFKCFHHFKEIKIKSFLLKIPSKWICLEKFLKSKEENRVFTISSPESYFDIF